MLRATREDWRGEGALRRRLTAVSHLLAGNLAGSILGLAAFALTARALGPAEYGVLALMHAYARAVERIVGFQSWQALIRYGAGLAGEERRADLQALLKLGFLLDLGAAAAAWALAVAGALAAGAWLGWDGRTTGLVVAYCAALLFNATGAATAVLRLAGRFRSVAYGQAANAALRLGLCAAGATLGGGLAFFALTWAGTQALGSLATQAFAWRELRRQGAARGLLRAPVRGAAARFPGLWGFAWSSNLSLTIRSSAHELDTLLVGALADPASAGLYHIAKRVGRLAQQVGAQVQAVLYPDVARLWAAGAVAEFTRAVLQVEALLAAFGAAAFLFLLAAAEPLLRWTAGPAFAGAAPLLVVQMLAVAATLAGSAVRSALLAMGRQAQVLSVVLAATLCFHATALALVPRIGAMGANVAHVVLGVVWLVGLTVAFRRALRREGAKGTPAAPASPAPGGAEA